jgi:hypothetical protein
MAFANITLDEVVKVLWLDASIGQRNARRVGSDEKSTSHLSFHDLASIRR